jgi:GDP-L-fucose synthase
MNILEKTDATGASLREKRIVVTGGAGLLGRAVVRRLFEQGYREISVPRGAASNLSRGEEIERLFDEAQPQIVVHLARAGDDGGWRGQEAEGFYNHVLRNTHLMETACRRGVEKMLCVGSAASYPANAPAPLRERDLFNGLPEPAMAIEGVVERLAFVQAQACREQYGFECIFLIPANIYGPGDNFDPETRALIPQLIRKFVEAAETGAREVTLAGSGSATREFLHVEDCAEGVRLALERYSGAEAVNIGSGSEVGIHELARRLARLAGYSGQILWDASQPDGPARRVLDSSRAVREFGFRARKSLQDGLYETVEWYRSMHARSEPELRKKAFATRA